MECVLGHLARQREVVIGSIRITDLSVETLSKERLASL